MFAVVAVVFQSYLQPTIGNGADSYCMVRGLIIAHVVSTLLVRSPERLT